MRRIVTRSRTTAGSAPGTLIYTGVQKVDQVTLRVVDYDEDHFREIPSANLDEALAACDTPRATWLNIEGLHDTELIGSIGRHLKIHPLTLEDVLQTTQRPKIERYDQYYYIVFRMLRYLPELEKIESEQISLVLTRHVLLCFQEHHGDVFEPVRERLQKGSGLIRRSGTDYLAYALIDAVVDHYFVILENIGTHIEGLEDQTLDSPNPSTLQQVHQLKREVLTLRKNIWPLRELLSAWIREESELICPDTGIYLRDVYDHTIQVIDTIEAYRDMLSSMLELYLSLVGNRTNEVMKLLTIIATIFIPLTFIAGVYGMNFEYMPELRWKFGYFFAWGVMGAVVLAMLLYFKRKKWL